MITLHNQSFRGASNVHFTFENGWTVSILIRDGDQSHMEMTRWKGDAKMEDPWIGDAHDFAGFLAETGAKSADPVKPEMKKQIDGWAQG